MESKKGIVFVQSERGVWCWGVEGNLELVTSCQCQFDLFSGR